MDGGVCFNLGFGGWVVIVVEGDQCIELSGGEDDMMNNCMELSVVIVVFEYLFVQSMVDFYIDLIYVCQGIMKWLFGWVCNNWVWC